MEIVSEGSLESISRPSSTASDKGRRSSRKVHNVQQLQHFSSLEILPPEELSGIPTELFSTLEKDVEVEEYEEVESDSNLESDSSLDEDLVQECYNNSDKEIIALESDSPYKNRTENISQQEELFALTDGDEVDPQIKEGMEKIKKLDKILADKIKKEKEVKNHRHQMEKMWKEQLQQVARAQDDGSHGNQSLIGATLLALELGNEDVLGSSRNDPVTPVFATQPLGTEENYIQCKRTPASGATRGCSRSSTPDDKTKKDKKAGTKDRDKRNSARNGGEKGDSSKKMHKTKEKHKDLEHNFIQRNKKLAADAANVIPMTEDEKKRLEELLCLDMNEMMENPYDDDSLHLIDGFGFRPDQESARALADIDAKLKELVPPCELEMLSSRALTDTPLTQRSEAASDASSQGTAKRVLENLDDVDIGERVLREGKETRDLNQRIMEIEMELKKLKEISEDESEDTISRALLDKLIGENSRTTSRSTTIAESVVSSLGTPQHFAIEQDHHYGRISRDEGDNSATPTIPSSVSVISDVPLTSTDIDTPRTLTSASSFDT